jgi:hypothetical protein
MALSAVLGCSRSPEPALTVPDSEYYPLKLGTRWVYRGGEHGRAMRVARHELAAGVPSALIETSSGGQVIATENVCVKDDGVYVLAQGGEALPRPLPLLRLPPTPGKTWNVNITRGGRKTRQTYLIGEGEVTVPAGKFATVTLRVEAVADGERTGAFTYWFAKDVGLVKQELRLEGRTEVYELERVERPGP